jgi:ABC-type multidrug transport system fused ATPase/permease subunit
MYIRMIIYKIIYLAFIFISAIFYIANLFSSSKSQNIQRQRIQNNLIKNLMQHFLSLSLNIAVKQITYASLFDNLFVTFVVS